MKIEDFNKRNTLGLPEGYFETLQSRITSQTCNAGKAELQKRRKSFGWRSLGYVASILAVAFIGKFTYDRNITGGAADYAANEEYYEREYIESILSSYPIDDYTFYCYLTDTDLNQ